MIDTDSVSQAARKISSSQFPIALTGAGISAESGIPPFRGRGGLWERYDPMEYAHIESFMRDPEKAWIMLAELTRAVLEAKPNPAHYALAELEKEGKLECIVTQNVDGLHQKAGNVKVVEFHGSNDRLLCLQCSKTFPVENIPLDVMPPRCGCGAVLKPDVVFFGEMIPSRCLSRAFKAANSCDLLMVIGTSAEVVPASQIPYLAKMNGATVIEVNTEESPLTRSIADIHITGKAGEVLPLITERLFQGEKADGQET